ncbi:MAG: ATP synthase subunit I [Acidimicrobiia bacterium]
MGSPFVTRLEGPAPEAQVAKDMIRRALPAAPVLIGLCAAMWSLDGAFSSAYGIAIVLANFALSAALLAYTARISLALLMGAALFGFLLRLGLIFAAVLLVKDAGWMHLGALGATLVVTHLGLLFWELRYVSLSLAHPGLKPGPKRTRPSQPAPKESVAP